MEGLLTQSTVRARAPLSALTKLMMASLAGLALALIYTQVMFTHGFALDLTIFAVVFLAVAIMSSTGWRWTPLLGALLCGLVVAGNIDHIIFAFTHPEDFHFFVYIVVAVALAVVGMAAGISAAVQNYRSRERRTPPIMAPALAAFAALCLGGILVGAIPREAAASISPEALEQLPAVVIPGFKFDRQALKVKAGETVALRLDNVHVAPHSFDINELNVHVPVAAGKTSLILFKPAKPGTYTFFCAVPGHREAGMVGTLVVEP